MYEAKKVHNIIKEMRRMKVDIMGNINEIRWGVSSGGTNHLLHEK